MFLQIAILISFFLGLWLTRKENKDIIKTLNKKEHPLASLYGLSYFLYEKISQIVGQNGSKNEERLRLLYVESQASIKKIHVLHRCKQVAILLLLVVVGSIMSIFLEVKYTAVKPVNEIARRNYGEGNEKHQVMLEKEGSEKEIVDLDVAQRQYSPEEYENKLKEAKAYVGENLKGENDSLDHVNTNLYFSSEVPDNDISITYSSLDLDLIDGKGVLYNDDLTEPLIVTIRVEYAYQQDSVFENILVCVDPPSISEEKAYLDEVKKDLKLLEEQSRTKSKLNLPSSIREFQISLMSKKPNHSMTVLFFCILMGGLLAFRTEEEIKSELKERDRQLLKDYPEVINKLVLLLGAGMTIRGVVMKLASDYQEAKKNGEPLRYFYEELVIMVYELQTGVPETQAFLHLGNQLKLAPYLKLSNYLVQNQKKGTNNLMELLEQEEIQAMETRREQARRLGEEASTKLLLPMLMLLLVVLILVMYPAILNFQL